MKRDSTRATGGTVRDGETGSTRATTPPAANPPASASGEPGRPALAGGAAIGYTILALSGLRYVSAGARRSLPLDTLVGVAGGVGLVVFLVMWRRSNRAGDEE
ncbi:hypothetical protein JCM17823_28190 [Halorubrum gandharaense]